MALTTVGAALLACCFLLHCVVIVVGQQPCSGYDGVKLKLDSRKSARYAGYYAAMKNNYYLDECIVILISEGLGENVSVIDEVTLRGSTVGSMPTYKFAMDAAKQNTSDVLHIAQIFQGSANVILYKYADAIGDGSLIGFMDEDGGEMRSLLYKALGWNPIIDYFPVMQDSRPEQMLFNKSVARISLRTYEEYTQLLRRINPATKELYKIEVDLFMDPFLMGQTTLDVGSLLLDGLFVKNSWYHEVGDYNKGVTTRFLKATLKGWAFCRDNMDECVAALNLPDVYGTKFSLNEVNALIWTSAQTKLGTLRDVDLSNTTSRLENAFGVKDVNQSIFDTSIIKQAQAEVTTEGGVDLIGENYKKSNLTWCLDPKGTQAIQCGSILPAEESSSDNTTTIIIATIVTFVFVCVICIILFGTIFAIIIMLRSRIKRPSVAPFAHFVNPISKNPKALRSDFKHLLKDFDFLSVFFKVSANSPETKDVRRAIVYFHINNNSIVDLFDHFLFKELTRFNNRLKLSRLEHQQQQSQNDIKTKNKNKNKNKNNNNSDSDSDSDSDTNSDSSVDTTSNSDYSDSSFASGRRSISSNPKKHLKKKNKSKLERPSLFREDSVVTDIFRYYSQIVGLAYLWYILSYPIKKLEQFGKKQNNYHHKRSNINIGKKSELPISTLQVFGLSVEVDPKKISLGDATINRLQLQVVVQQLFVSITRSSDSFPVPLKEILKRVEERVSEVYKNEGPEVTTESLANFVFLRYICSALISPHEYGLLSEPPSSDTRRVLILLSKVLQNLANGALFEKEEYMLDLNDFIKNNLGKMQTFLKQLLKGYTLLNYEQTSDSRVPLDIENIGLTILYNYCKTHRNRIFEALSQANADSRFPFSDLFPIDKSNNDDVDV